MIAEWSILSAMWHWNRIRQGTCSFCYFAQPTVCWSCFMERTAPGDTAQAAAEPQRRKLKGRHCIFDDLYYFNQFNQKETNLAPTVYITNFNAHFPNPLALSTACDWIKRESIVKSKQSYALNVGKCVMDKYVRYIHRRDPSKLRSQSSLRVYHMILLWCSITNSRSHAVLTLFRFTCLELWRLCRSDPRPEALVQSQTTRISDGRGYLLCVIWSAYHVFCNGATWQLWSATLFCQSMPLKNKRSQQCINTQRRKRRILWWRVHLKQIIIREVIKLIVFPEFTSLEISPHSWRINIYCTSGVHYAFLVLRTCIGLSVVFSITCKYIYDHKTWKNDAIADV